MDAIVMAIVKKQNEVLLRAIAKKYNLDEEVLLQKYWTPSFYKPIVSQK